MNRLAVGSLMTLGFVLVISDSIGMAYRLRALTHIDVYDNVSRYSFVAGVTLTLLATVRLVTSVERRLHVMLLVWVVTLASMISTGISMMGKDLYDRPSFGIEMAETLLGNVAVSIGLGVACFFVSGLLIRGYPVNKKLV